MIQRLWGGIHRASPFGARMLMTLSANAVIALLGMVTGILAARLLGPEGRGELAAIQMWPSLIATLAMLGLPDSLVYYSARQPARAGSQLGTAMILALLASLPFLAAGYVAIPYLLSAQSPETTAAARWYLLLVPIFALVGMPHHPLRGRNDFVAWNALRVAPNVGWLLVLVTAWIIGMAQSSSLAVAYLGVLVLLIFPVMFVVTQRIPGPYWPERKLSGPLLRYGLPSMLSSVPQMLNVRLDQLMLAALLPTKTLGIYVVAVAWSSVVHPAMNALGSVLFPRVANEPTPLRQHQMFAQGARLGVFLGSAMGIVLLALTPYAVPLLFGSAFVDAKGPAMILVVAAIASALNSIMEEGLRGMGHPQLVLRAEFMGLAVTVVALTILLARFDVYGAAGASLLGATSVTVVLAYYSRRVTESPLTEILLPRLGDIRHGYQRFLEMARGATRG